MVTIAIHSPSAAVTQNLRLLLQAAAYAVTEAADAAMQLTIAPPHLRLRYADTETALALPIAPHRLLQAIAHCLAATPSGAVPLHHGWLFHPTLRCVTHPVQGEHPLTEKESLLLSALIAAMPNACAREGLLQNIWRYDAATETHTLETHIYRLRQKLATLTPSPGDIETSDGAYRLR